MTDITQHVTSLELSKKLWELGVKRVPFYCWAQIAGKYAVHPHHGLMEFSNGFVPAYLASELWDMLPEFISSYKGISRDDNNCHIISAGIEEHYLNLEEARQFSSHTEADCRAKVLIYLIESGHVKAEDL